MSVVLLYACALLVAVLLSDLANRSVLSTAVLFLAAGFVAGPGVLGLLPENAIQLPLVKRFSELALFVVLYTDAMKVGARDLARAWKLPGRALLLGLPINLVITAVLARFVLGLDWTESLLVAAVLAPTDPVLAAAIVGSEEVPARLRHLLNVESGVNDGLALPFVVIFLALAGHHEVHLGQVMLDIVIGIALGVAIPFVALKLERMPFFSLAPSYEPLYAVAIGLLVLGATALVGANEFLGAFAAGVTVASVRPETRDAFAPFGEILTELFKLAALLVFGGLIRPDLFFAAGWRAWGFAALAIFVTRPVSLLIALLKSPLDRRERLVAGWFGPKGFASILYGLLVLGLGTQEALPMFRVIALTVAVSIVLHSSSDVLVARWFEKEEGAARRAE